MGIIKKTIEKRNALQERKRIMEAKRAYLVSRQEVEGICFIKVKHTCFEDVYITIKNLKMTVTQRRENILFYEDPKDEKIKTGAYT
jgi:hypothetical protein